MNLAPTFSDPQAIAGAPATFQHTPVLAEAVRRLAQAGPGQRWVDGTLGLGGHTGLLLADGAEVVGFDQDPQARAIAAARLAPFGDRLQIIADNFRHAHGHLEARGLLPLDGLLVDLGVSSGQLDTPERGFSFSAAGPVDMRMDPSKGAPALALIEGSTVPELAQILRTYGEEPFAGPIARAIKAWQQSAAEKNTQSLAAAITQALPVGERHRRKIHPATLSFQALRIAVNDELGALETLLADLPRLLAPGGRALFISFHSLEDRLVKRAFAALCTPPAPPRRGLPVPADQQPEFTFLSRRGETASAQECAANPRARSARLRAIRHIGVEGAGGL